MMKSRSYYDQMNTGLNPNGMRSEGTLNEMARRDLSQNPPVTVLGDMLGRIDPARGQLNALIDAIRAKAIQNMVETGGAPFDTFGSKSTYGK